MEVEEKEMEMEIIYRSLHCHHQNDRCIKMGSEESHFNVSLIVRDKVTRQYSQPQLLKREESRSGIEPRSFCFNQPNALPLSQTGSQRVTDNAKQLRASYQSPRQGCCIGVCAFGKSRAKQKSVLP